VNQLGELLSYGSRKYRYGKILCAFYPASFRLLSAALASACRTVSLGSALQARAANLIPSMAVPISIIGTFAAMQLLG